MRKLAALVFGLALIAVPVMGQTVTGLTNLNVSDSLGVGGNAIVAGYATADSIEADHAYIGGTAEIIGTLDVTGVASLDGNDLTAGTSFSTAALVYTASAVKIGSMYKTTYWIDLTGTRGTAGGDIIGDDGDTTNAAHIGQLLTTKCGTIFWGQITCLETPAGGDPDVDLWYATEGTGREDDAISGLIETQMINNGDWTGAIATPVVLSAFPAANSYLYLVAGGTTDADYSAGQFLIELWGK